MAPISFFKMGQPQSLFRLFSDLSNKQYIFLQQINVKIPSSIRCRDSNPQPLEHESSPITTRPMKFQRIVIPLIVFIFLLFCSALSL